MNRLAILGSTGSIGCSTLAVVDAHPDQLRIVALAAGGNATRLAEQVARHAPSIVAMSSDGRGRVAWRRAPAPRRDRRRRPCARRRRPRRGGDASRRRHGAVRLVRHRQPRRSARRDRRRQAHRAREQGSPRHGRRTGDGARRGPRGVDVLPVDSEHNAIHQCLHGRPPSGSQAPDSDRVGRAVPRALRGERSGRVTPDDALRHPTWNMGPKITIDSATLMNKGLEVIEARWLFDVDARPDRRRRPSAVDRPLDGRVRGRLDPGAAGRHRHAAADPVRAVVSRSLACDSAAARPRGLRHPDLRAG